MKKIHYYFGWFNGIIPKQVTQMLSRDIPNRKSLVAITTDPSDYECADEMTAFVKDTWFEPAHIVFEKYDTIDYRTQKDEAYELLKNASVILLHGGYPDRLNGFLKEYELSKAISESNAAVIIGASAGGMNMCAKFSYGKYIDENNREPAQTYNGLGLDDFALHSHAICDIESLAQQEHVKKYLMPLSESVDVYVACEESTIRVKNGQFEVMGDVYLIAKSRIEKMEESMFTIEKFDEGNLQELFLIESTMVEKYGFLNRFRNADEYKDLFLPPFTMGDNELFIIRKGALPCGVISFVKSADWGGKERYDLTIRLGDTHISELLLACLKQFICEKITEHKQIAIITYNDELKGLIDGFSSKVQLKANVYTLDKNDIDVSALSKHIAEYQAINSNLRMVYTDIISEEYIEQWCNLFMEASLDMTDEKEDAYVRYVMTPEKQRQSMESAAKKNITHHCYMIFDEGEMVGKTNVAVNGNDSRFPYQFMIGVKAQYRGRGLGKWLYATMYKKLFEEVDFEKANVKHHPENKSIINISEWIGYKFAFRETTYLVQSDEA